VNPRRALLALILAGLCLASASTASASSIVYIHGGDIWLSTPDGTRQHQVTSGGAFTDVTQADDGTIFGASGGSVYRLDAQGRQLHAPISGGAMYDIDVSPDGSKLTYWFSSGTRAYYGVINTDGTFSGWADQYGWYPTWITNDLTLESDFDIGHVQTTTSADWQYWFSNPDARKHSSAITRAQDRLVVVTRNYESTGDWIVAHYSNSSQPPRGGGVDDPPADQRPVFKCTSNYHAVEPSHPSFAPDGSMIAWERPEGIRVQPVVTLDPCAQPPGGFSIAGASSPDWGPADVPAEQAPPDEPPPDNGGDASPATCFVPYLKGKTLPRAKKALKSHHCGLGSVKKRRSARRPGTVIKQSIAPYHERRAGTKVGVVIAKRR
jgi:hypothetical protein